MANCADFSKDISGSVRLQESNPVTPSGIWPFLNRTEMDDLRAAADDMKNRRLRACPTKFFRLLSDDSVADYFTKPTSAARVPATGVR